MPPIIVVSGSAVEVTCTFVEEVVVVLTIMSDVSFVVTIICGVVVNIVEVPYSRVAPSLDKVV